MSTTAGMRASARLGLTLRQVLLAPRDGFEAAQKMAARRERAGLAPAEGRMPHVLAALGGAALTVVWLKVAGLVGLREVAAAEFRWANLLAALLVGAVLAPVGMALWGRLGPVVVDALQGVASAAECRIVWGASALPQALTVLVLVPLDLIVVGPEVFATDNLADPVATAWAAFSIAVGLACAAWSAFLFVVGIEVTASLPASRAIGAAFAALLCLGAPVAVVLFAVSEIARSFG